MNKKKLILIILVCTTLLSFFLVYKFVIGFKVKTRSEIKKITKDNTDISLYVLDLYGEKFLIDNTEDIEEILEILKETKIKWSNGNYWVGGAYSLQFVDENTNYSVKVTIHPIQISINNTRFFTVEEDGEYYKKIEEILKKYINPRYYKG